MRLRKRTKKLGIIRTRFSQILMTTGLSVGLAWQASALAASPAASSYLGLGEDCCGEDPHPVHGIQTSDGGYVLVGKSADASGATDGFILKVKARPGAMNAWVGPDSFQSGEWAQSVGTRGGLDGMNNVVETTNGILIGAGFQATNDGKVHRYWASYDLQTGTKRWEAQVPSPQSNKISAFESLSPTRDGGVIVTGVLNAAPGSFEGFKSYGNPVDGQAFVAYYSAEQISGTSTPGAPTWETLIPNGMSGKSVRELPGDGAGFIAGVAGMEGEAPYLVRLSATGAIEWQQAYDNHGELTDVAVLSENGTLQGFVIVGHRGGSVGGIDGSITKVSPSGTVVWESLVGNPVGGTGPFAGLGAGNPQLIFDECWGVQGTIDGGAIVGCGTGIEGCDEYASNSAIGSECRNDPRTMWRGLVVKLDKNGQEVWSRVDSFVEGGEYLESASEYVSLNANGEVMSVVDQGFGIGILTLEASSSNRPGVSDGSGDGGTDDGGSGSIDESDASEASDPSDPTDGSDASDASEASDVDETEDDTDASDTEEGESSSDTEEGNDSSDEDEAVTTIDEGGGGCAGTQGASVLSLALGLIFLMRARQTARGRQA